jgi:membrane-associated phospholipid phosphatase
MFVLAFVGVLIPVSRMYLGSHSGNQIMMSLTFAMTGLIIYRYYLQ